MVIVGAANSTDCTTPFVCSSIKANDKVCCGKAAKCADYSGCPQNQTIVAGAASTDCKTSGTCPDTEDNDGTCCGPPANCTGYSGCQEYQLVKTDGGNCATSGKCSNTEENSKICCENNTSANVGTMGATTSGLLMGMVILCWW